MKERADFEREVITLLAKRPENRKLFMKNGVHIEWFRDPYCRRAWEKIARNRKEKKLSINVIQRYAGPNFEFVPFSEDSEELLDQFREVVIQDELVIRMGDLTTSKESGANLISSGSTILSILRSYLSTSNDNFLGNPESIWEAYLKRKNMEGLTGFPYPWATFNRVTAGINKCEYVLFYGHPKAMKTWLLLVSAHHVWNECGVPIAIRSREMAQEMMKQRFILLHAALDYTRFIQGLLTKDEEDRLQWAIEDVKEREKSAPILYPPCIGMGAEAITCYQAAIEGTGTRINFLDGIQTLGFDYKDIMAASREIKQIALSNGVPWVVTAQSNRQLSRAISSKKSSDPEQDMGGAISLVQDPDTLFRVVKKHASSLYISAPAIREAMEVEINIRAMPAISFEEIREGQSLVTRDNAQHIVGDDSGLEIDDEEIFNE